MRYGEIYALIFLIYFVELKKESGMECIYEPHLKLCAGSKSIIKITGKKLETVKTKSIKRKDNFKKKLEGLSEAEKDDLSCHENCISTNISDFHITCYILKQIRQRMMQVLQQNVRADLQKHHSHGRRIASFVVKYVYWK